MLNPQFSNFRIIGMANNVDPDQLTSLAPSVWSGSILPTRPVVHYLGSLQSISIIRIILPRHEKTWSSGFPTM